MKRNETVSNTKSAAGGSGTAVRNGTSRQSHAPSFAKALNGRKQPIRGLWIRNGRFYARLAVENPITGEKKVRRVPLKDKDGQPVETVAQAVAELKRLQTQRADNALPVLERTPKFTDYAARYLDFTASGQGAKKAGTVEKERAILGRWTDAIGQLRVDQTMCVMSGVDFMTIAAWVGHKDGGVLIGKVYGHLANEHRKAMAERVNFGPAIAVKNEAA